MKKLAVKVGLSLLVLGVCLWLVWPKSGQQQRELISALRSRELKTFWPYLVGYVVLLGATHFFRAWRWNNLLEPIGATLPRGQLLSFSSIGFMTILAFPARLGEFVRPMLVRRQGRASGSAVLGTVAVERVIDGLLVSILVFCSCYALRGPKAPSWMMPMAWASLGIFAAATTFLLFALRRPEATVRFCVGLTLTPRLAPKLACVLQDKLHKLIRGFLVLNDKRNLGIFVFWSALYWLSNGLGMWVLALGFDLGLSVVGAFATMGIIAVGITAPNSPGLVAQFHWLTVQGLSLYLPANDAETTGKAYAIVLHLIQVIWYVGLGAVAMLISRVSFADLVAHSPEEEDLRPQEAPRLGTQ